MNIKDINLKTIKIEGISKRYYPDCVNSYCAYVEYKSGIPLNDIELDIFNDQYIEKIQELARKQDFEG